MQSESDGHCDKVQCQNKGGNDVCLCPLEGVINIIAKKWALLIIATIGNHGTIRFNRISEILEGISPKTLSERLKELEHAGVIQKEVFTQIPLRAEYSLTKDGLELRDAMKPLLEWASKKDGARS